MSIARGRRGDGHSIGGRSARRAEAHRGARTGRRDRANTLGRATASAFAARTAARGGGHRAGRGAGAGELVVARPALRRGGVGRGALTTPKHPVCNSVREAFGTLSAWPTSVVTTPGLATPRTTLSSG